MPVPSIHAQLILHLAPKSACDPLAYLLGGKLYDRPGPDIPPAQISWQEQICPQTACQEDIRRGITAGWHLGVVVYRNRSEYTQSYSIILIRQVTLTANLSRHPCISTPIFACMKVVESYGVGYC